MLQDRKAGRNIAAALILLAASSATPALAQPYLTISLGANAVATDINNRPQVVGCVWNGDFSTCDGVIWDYAGVHRLGLAVEPSAGLHINDASIVAGLRRVGAAQRVFAWVNGIIFDLPPLPADEPRRLLTLTNTNVLLVQGERRSWRFADGGWIDLTAETGAEIFCLNEAGVLGGLKDGRAFLRLADGQTLVPWTLALPVEVLGRSGHFAAGWPGGSGFPYWLYGQPDGSSSLTSVNVLDKNFEVADINGAGDVAGTYTYKPLGTVDPRLWRDVGFIYRRGAYEWLPLTGVAAMNEAGYVVGRDAAGAAVLVPAVSPPTGLTFSVTDRLVTLRWLPIPGALDYVVEAGSVAAATDLFNASVGAVPSVVTSAPPGRYFVRVRARTAAGVSGPSPEIIVDVP
jgi:hypothetical protein